MGSSVLNLLLIISANLPIVKLEDAIEIDTVDEVPQTPRTAEPRTAEPKTPHGPKFDEGLFAPTNLSK